MKTPERIWSTSFGLIWSFAFLTFFSAFQLFPTAPLRLQELGSTLGHSGRFLTIFTLGSSVGALFTGTVGDRVGHRRMMIITAFLFSGISVVYAFTNNMLVFYLLAPFHGIVWSGLLTSVQAKAGGIIPSELRTQGFALFGLAGPLGVVLGPTAGVWIYQNLGWFGQCMSLMICFAVIAFLGFFIPRDSYSPNKTVSGFQKPDPLILILSSLLFCQAIAYGALNSYSAQEGLALGLSWPAAGLGSMGLGMIAMRIWVGSFGFGKETLRRLPAMTMLATMGILVLSFPGGGLFRLVIAGLLFGAGYSMVFTILNTTLMENVSESQRGNAFGTFMFAFDAGIGLGSMIIGYFIGTYSYAFGWLLGGLAMALGIPVAYHIRQRLMPGHAKQLQD